MGAFAKDFEMVSMFMMRLHSVCLSLMSQSFYFSLLQFIAVSFICVRVNDVKRFCLQIITVSFVSTSPGS